MVIATAATSAVLSNATDSESFTNKALKVLFVIGAGILLAGTGIVILLLLDVLDAVGAVFDAGATFLDALNPFNDVGSPIRNPVTAFFLSAPTYFLSSWLGR